MGDFSVPAGLSLCLNKVEVVCFSWARFFRGLYFPQGDGAAYRDLLVLIMPFSYSIDRKARVVATVFSGKLTDSDVGELIEQLRKDPAYDPNFDELIDCSAVTENQVSQKTLGSEQPFSISARRAVVAPSNVNYGVSRMFQTLQANPHIEVFRTIEQARAWLGLASDSSKAG